MSRDLDALADLVTITQAWEQTGSSTAQLLRQSLPVLQIALPHITTLRLYSIHNGAAELIAATDRDIEGADPTMASNLKPDLVEVLSADSHLVASGRPAWLLPLRRNMQVVQILEIGYDDTASGSGHAPAWVDRVGYHLNSAIDRQPLITSQKRLTEEIAQARAVNDFVTGLSATQEETAILKRAAETLVNVTGCDYANFSLLNEDSASATFVVEYPERGLAGQAIDSDDLLLHKVRDTLETLVIQDVENSPILDAKSRGALKDLKVNAVALIPVIDAHGVYLGAAGVDFETPGRTFDSSMLNRAEMIVSQAANAVQNSRLLKQTQRQSQQLQHVAAFGQALQTITDFDALFKSALDFVSDAIDADHVSVLRFDIADAALKEAAWRDDNQTYVNLNTGEPVAIAESVSGRVWTTKESLAILDLQASADFGRHRRENIRSLIAEPLYSHGAPYGVIEVGALTPGAFSETDHAILKQLIRQLTTALEAVESYEQGQRVTRTKALANEIASHLQQQIEIDQILRVTVSELGRALGAKRGRIQLANPASVQQNVTE